MIRPGVQIKSVEGDALFTYSNFSDIGTNFGIEAIAVHAQISRGIPQPE
ncbi:MAG: hypothetical protein AB2672_13535 [Candidatus Thiodiazotropha endolucinida]